jgi:surface carbohydrate biosynthesis protein (TIGR04326 family)
VSNCVFVWDVDGLPPESDWTVVLWRGFAPSASPSIISIPKLVEDNADVLKARYLAWVYDLGEKCIDGKRVVDHLEIRPEFSCWWMTLIAEKCNYAASQHINDAIRLMAFDTWTTSRSVRRVVLVSSNQPLAECMRLWCAALGVPFEWQQIDSQSVNLSLVRRIYQFLPQFLQALASFLFYLVDRWPLRGVGLKEWRQTRGRVAFISYLFNLEPVAAKTGRYESRYWADFPTELQRGGCKTNWLHLYLKDPLLPTAGKAASIIHEFNRTGKGEQVHVTLDSFLSVRVAFKTLRDWCRLALSGKRLEPEISTVTSNGLSLWPLYSKEWSESTVGPKSIINALNLNLFETATKALPKQRAGIYLYEQQPWELALIHAWKSSGHGCLIGAQHTTMLFWSLRFFHDQRSYKRSGCNELPMPNKVAVNGPIAMKTCLQARYPEEALVEVEALRYLYLSEAKIEICAGRVFEHGPEKRILQVLVLGDYLPSNMQRQMNLLVQAMPLLPMAVNITVKPHPDFLVHPDEYPSLNMTVTMESIGKLLAECDVAYSSNATSAAVDAYCVGVPIISLLDPMTLNLSPLRDCTGTLFASTPKELATALLFAASAPRLPSSQQEFFTIDPQLPRWRKLLLESIV